MEALEARNEKITYCLVGEPSSTDTLGDIIKNGRRGSFAPSLPSLANRVMLPTRIWLAIRFMQAMALAELTNATWDNGNEYFATSLQISNINGGTGATNVIPETLTVIFNFRFSTETTEEELKARTHAIFDKYFENSKASYDIHWKYPVIRF